MNEDNSLGNTVETAMRPEETIEDEHLDEEGTFPRQRLSTKAGLTPQRPSATTPGAQAVYYSPSTTINTFHSSSNDEELRDTTHVDIAEDLCNISATVVVENGVVEATRIDESATRKYQRLRWYLAAMILLLVLVVILVAVVVIRRNKTPSGNSLVVTTTTSESSTSPSPVSPSLSVSPSLWPTFIPSSSPTSLLQAFLASVSLDGGAALAEVGSPQRRALLTIQGELLVEPDMPMERILQRYALETFYFSTDGARWSSHAKWSIEAQDVTVPIGGSAQYVVDECDWFGVTCDRDGTATAMDLFAIDLFGTLPDELALLSQLTSLHLAGNSLQHSIPVGLQQMSNLESLDLADNRLESGFSSEMGSMTSLQYLNMTRSIHLGWIMPTEIGLLTNLRSMFMVDTQLVGEIVSEMGKLFQLTTLSLVANSLHGSIPTELSLARSLSHLTVAHNRLEWKIPTELGLLYQLTNLELSSNRFTGMIPSELGLLGQLTKLTLAENALTGEIPSELGLLTNLSTLFVHGPVMGGNNFTGTVPQQVCDHLDDYNVILGCYDRRFLTACDCTENNLCPPPLCA